MNFRIVLNNAEITSIESLQKFFDFEKFLVNDQMQLIRWLKWVDKKKGSQKGEQIETIFKDYREGVINNVAIPLIMSIIYEANFSDIIQFVDFLYGLNKEYDSAKNNFSQFISNHGEMLHRLFPIDNIPRGNNNLDIFFTDLNTSPEISSYLSELYYRQGRIEVSQKEDPSSWELSDTERTIIKGVSAGHQVFPFSNLSIIGTEFIFLCAITYLTIYPEDKTINALSEQIDQNPKFKPMRDRIGGSLKKLINKKGRDCYQICERLGYTTPKEMDPLFNEKLFLSSFSADDDKRDELLSIIKKKNDYFPALFVLYSDSYESSILQSKQNVPLIWFNYILDYHDKPLGLDGDYDKNDNGVNEMSIIRNQFEKAPTLMKEFFCNPNALDPTQGELYLREHIQRIKQSAPFNKPNSKTFALSFFTALPSAPLKKNEKYYFDFFKEVIYLCSHWNEYIDPSKGGFTPKAEKLIEEYRNNNSALYKERLFVVTILILVKDHNRNIIYYANTANKSLNEMYSEIKRLSQSYIPLKGLFKNQILQLNTNDREILNLNIITSKGLNDFWIYEPLDLGSLSLRQEYYNKILKRWIANFVYYI